jgi:RNA polymerase sigma-70 factor (ECF subfamily)
MGAHEELIHSFREGKTEAMEELIELYKHDVYNLCYRLTFDTHAADELFQDTWLHAVKSAGHYREKSFQNWLYTICLNCYRDIRRREKRRGGFLTESFATDEAKEYAMSLIASDDNVEETAEERYTRALLLSHIEHLSEKLKLPVKLYYFSNQNYAQIASILRIPEGTVKSRLNAAKVQLRTMMEREADV